jgi:hypothetical protein
MTRNHFDCGSCYYVFCILICEVNAVVLIQLNFEKLTLTFSPSRLFNYVVIVCVPFFRNAFVREGALVVF